MSITSRVDLNIDQGRNDETRNVENFEDSNIASMKPIYDRNAHSHHSRLIATLLETNEWSHQNICFDGALFKQSIFSWIEKLYFWRFILFTGPWRNLSKMNVYIVFWMVANYEGRVQSFNTL